MKTYLFTKDDLNGVLLCCGWQMKAVKGLWAASCLACGTVCILKLTERTDD